MSSRILKLNEANESEEVVMGRGGTRPFSSFSSYLVHFNAPTFCFQLLSPYSHSSCSSLPPCNIFSWSYRPLHPGSEMQLFPTPSINHRSLRGAPYANQVCHSNASLSTELIKEPHSPPSSAEPNSDVEALCARLMLSYAGQEPL